MVKGTMRLYGNEPNNAYLWFSDLTPKDIRELYL